MKKVLFLLMLTTLLFACDDNDEVAPLPTINGVTISDDFNPQTSSLPIGDSLKFSIDATNAITCQWFVNQKLAGEGSYFIFTPTERGEYSIKVIAQNEDKQEKEFEIGTIRVTDPLPVISGITCNGEAVQGDSITIGVGKPAVLAIQCTNAEVASCSWRVDGQTIEGADSLKYSFTTEWSGTHIINIKVKNRDGAETEKSYILTAVGPYKNTPLLILESDQGMSYGEIAVIENGVIKENQFQAVNNSFIPASVNDATMFKNSIYFLSTAEDIIYEADIQTLKLKRKIKKTTQLKATVRRMIVANDNKAYVTLYNPYNLNQGAILPIDLAQGKIEKAIDIAGIFDGEMFVLGEKVIFGAGNKLQYIDPATDKITLIHEFDIDVAIKGIKLGKDKRLYVLASVGNKSRMIGMNSSSFVIESTVNMDAELSNTAALCASTAQNKLYFVSTGSGWNIPSKIYCYDTDTQKAIIFKEPQKAMYGYMTISADGDTLYFPWNANFISYGFIAYSLNGNNHQEYNLNSATCKAIDK